MWGMEYLDFGHLPECTCGRNEAVDKLYNGRLEGALETEVAGADAAKDAVDGGVGGEGAVEDGELALEALRDVVTPPARVDHCCQELCT